MDILSHHGYDRLFTNEFLRKCHSNPDPIDRQEPFQIVIGAYIENNGFLASLTLNVFEVQTDNNEKMVNVLELPICKEGLHFTEVYKAIKETVKKYPNAVWSLGGTGTCLNRIASYLRCENASFEHVYWGGACFGQEDRQRYANKRSMAYAGLRRAVIGQRLRIPSFAQEARTLSQLEKIGCKFDCNGRFKVSSSVISGKVPLANTLAFPFMTTSIDKALKTEDLVAAAFF